MRHAGLQWSVRLERFERSVWQHLLFLPTVRMYLPNLSIVLKSTQALALDTGNSASACTLLICLCTYTLMPRAVV